MMPNGFFIHSSNQLEILAEQLALILRTPPSNASETVLVPETIVVQSKGMERWLSLAIARHNGISANCRFPFPNAFLDDIFEKSLGDAAISSNGFDPRIMTFRIMAKISGLIDAPAFEPVRRYLTDDPDQRKLFQLSDKLADTFDQYLMFRPEMIARWEAGDAPGEGENWQAILWRVLTDQERNHRARLREAFLRAARQGALNVKALPLRILIFGISYLPLFHLRVVETLASFLPVHLFLLNPCQEYWGDIVSDAEQKKIRERYHDSISGATGLALESGNGLLASLGGMGRDFFSLLTTMEIQLVESFTPPAEKNLLECIQGDILNLRERRIAVEAPAIPDGSIQIHACHSPMREIEVLFDQMLAMFEEDPDMTPKDIIVMAPDIESYSPYIRAVFDTPESHVTRIPYSIADRSMRRERRVVDDFLKLMALKNSRLGATPILSILDSPHIKEAYALSDEDMEIIVRWVRETNIRWGRDAQFIKTLGLPGFEEHTWRYGINRMLLGYALPGNGERLFSGIVPYDHIEGKEGLILGRFITFLERLFSWLAMLEAPKPLHQWADLLQEALTAFFGTNDTLSREIGIIREIVTGLKEIERISQNLAPITFEVISDYVTRLLSTPMSGTGFISGGVTFCSMLPMRAVPAKVICMIGMQNDAFPRESRFPSFNRIAAQPRPGDRSRRNDDKYLFLESIISARKKIYISFVGQRIQDNALIPPSGLVSELMDYMKAAFDIDPESMITRHRLQAFSPAYFREDSRLFSYSEGNLRASRSLNAPKAGRTLFTERLPVPPNEFQRLHGEELAAFFSRPCRYLLEERLGITLRTRRETLEDREVFNLDPLDQYRIGRELLEIGLSGQDLTDHLEAQRAKGNLPSGKVGQVVFEHLRAETEAFKEKIAPYIGMASPIGKEYRFSIGEFEFSGSLTGIYPDAMIFTRFGNTRPNDLLTAFIRHLFLSHLAEPELPRETYLLCKDSAWKFSSLSGAGELLHAYLDFYWEGLQWPLNFFPLTSYEYARRVIIRSEASVSAIAAAQRKWDGSDYMPGEGADPYHRLCFGEESPLGPLFEDTALKIFTPLMDAYTEIFI